MNAEQRILAWLERADFTGTGCRWSQERIGEAVGCSRETVNRLTQKLARDDRIDSWLERRPGCKWPCRVYRVKHWNPHKRSGVLNVLRSIQERREAQCHTERTARPSRAHSLRTNPSFSASEALPARSRAREATETRFRRSTCMDRRELRLEVDCEECARKDRIIRQYAENHSKLVEEVSAAHNVARAAGKEVTKLRGQLTKQDNESARAEQVELVVECWRRHRPKASKAFGKPGSKSFAVIEKALVLMADEDGGAVKACCEAIDGLHLAPYERYGERFLLPGPERTLRNDVEHALRDEVRIAKCRSIVAKARNVSLDAKFRAYEVLGETHSAWARVLMGELWTQPEDVSVVVDGLVVRP